MNNSTYPTPPPYAGSAFVVPLCSDYAPPRVESFTFHLLWTFFFTAVYFVADLCLKRLLPDSNTRWFGLHALANLVTTLGAAQDLASVFLHPLCGMVSPTHSWVPTHAGMAVHLYHILGFFPFLRFEDWMHHLLFGGGMGALNFLLPWGRVTNALLFFITGLPGGITYFMLVMVKLGRIPSLTEKAISAQINTWLRTPGLMWFTSVILFNFAHGTMHVPPWAACLCVLLSFTNGQFYGAQALENFIVRRTEAKLQAALQKDRQGEAAL